MNLFRTLRGACDPSLFQKVPTHSRFWEQACSSLWGAPSRGLPVTSAEPGTESSEPGRSDLAAVLLPGGPAFQSSPPGLLDLPSAAVCDVCLKLGGSPRQQSAALKCKLRSGRSAAWRAARRERTPHGLITQPSAEVRRSGGRTHISPAPPAPFRVTNLRSFQLAFNAFVSAPFLTS